MTSTSLDGMSPEEQRRVWVAEYRVIEDLHRHYDTINMSLMAILVAGVFAVWGFVLQQATLIKPTTTFLIEWLTFIVLSLWIQYVTVHRTIVVVKLRRAREIEGVLGMSQNLCFMGLPRRLRGQTLELATYGALVVFGLVFTAYFQVGLNNPAITTVPEIVANIQRGWTVLHVIRLVLSVLPCGIGVLWAACCWAQVANVTENYIPPRRLRWLLRLGGYRG